MSLCPRCPSTEAYTEEVEPGILYVECDCSGPFYADARPPVEVYGPRVVGWGVA